MSRQKENGDSLNQIKQFISFIEEEEELQLPLLKWLNKGNSDRVISFLEINKIDDIYFINLVGVFFALFLTNPNEDHNHNIAKFKKNKKIVEYLERHITLLQLEKDNFLMEQLNIDPQLVEKIKNVCVAVAKDERQRYNYKTYLFEKLESFFEFSYLNKMRRKDQIDIAYKILREESFEDYGSDNYIGEKKKRLEKLRDKTIKRWKRIYGT